MFNTVCCIRKQFSANFCEVIYPSGLFLFSLVVMGKTMSNLFHRITSEIGFCSHAELSCAYRFVVNVNSAALCRNFAWNNSQNMSCRYYACSPTGEVKAPQITKAFVVLTPRDGTISIILYCFFSCWTEERPCFPAEKR